MILAEVGGAVGADAVLLEADAVHIEAAHDRPARRAGCETRTGDARFGEQQIAQRAAAASLDFLGGDHSHRAELISNDRQCAEQRDIGRCDRCCRGHWHRVGGGLRRPSPHDRARCRDGDLGKLQRFLCGEFATERREDDNAKR